MRRSLLLFAAVLVGVALASPTALAASGGKVIYDSTVRPLPPNLPSEGPEAYAFAEFGDEVTFAAGPRQLGMVTVTLSSWACQSGHWYSNDCVTSPGATFALPITFKVYNPGANDTAGSVLGTRTQTFQVPYRPSADSVHCNGSDAGKWFAGEKGCFNGLAHNITFDFSGQHIQLPNTVVYGVSYNSTHYGPNPVGESAACFASSAGCFYDSLNIGLAPKVTVGSKPHPDTIYQNSANGAEYCDGGAAGVGTMRLDSPGNACWTGYVPAARFVAGKEGGGDGNDNGGGNNGNDGGDNGDGSAGA